MTTPNNPKQAYRDWRARETNSLRPPPSFAKPPPGSRLLLAVAILAAIVLVVIVGGYVASIPPAHLLIIGAVCLWPLGWLRKKTKKEQP